jgi:hypothetical protein
MLFLPLVAGGPWYATRDQVHQQQHVHPGAFTAVGITGSQVYRLYCLQMLDARGLVGM